MFNRFKFIKLKLPIISSYIVMILVLFLSIGFSAYYEELSIKNIKALVRVNADIRVTSVVSKETYNEGYSTNLNYNKSNINGSIVLPNEDSYVDFTVRITNIGNVEMGIKDITIDNDKLSYEVLDYNMKDKICVEVEEKLKCTLGVEKDITIRIKWKEGNYNSEEFENSFILNFDFQNYHKVYVEELLNDKITDCPEEVLNTDDLTFKYSGERFDVRIYMNGERFTDYLLEDGVVTIKNVTGTVHIKYISYNIENGSFEVPEIKAGYSYIKSEKALSWNTTDTSNQIELGSIYNSRNEHLGITADSVIDSQLPDGDQLAEINANEKATIFQNIQVTNGETYNWDLYHRGRGGIEVMALIIGNKQENVQIKPNKQTDDQFNQMVTWLLENQTIDMKVPTKKIKFTIYSPPFNNSGGFEGNEESTFKLEADSTHTERWDIWIIVSSNIKWNEYNDSYQTHSDEIVFALCSVSSAKQDDLSYGNLIDKVSFRNNNEEKIINGSFEYLSISPKGYYHFSAENSSNPSEGIGWSTTAIDKKIEVGSFENGKKAYLINKDFISSGPYVKDGNNFIELNAAETGTIYQNFLTVKNKTHELSFSHRGREGIDYITVFLGTTQRFNPSKEAAKSKDQFMKMVDFIKQNIDLNTYGLDYRNLATGCSNKIVLYTAKFSTNGSFEVEDSNAISLTKDEIHTEHWDVWVVGSNNDDWYTYGKYDENKNYDNTYTNTTDQEETTLAFTNYETYGQRNNEAKGASVGNLLDYICWD